METYINSHFLLLIFWNFGLKFVQNLDGNLTIEGRHNNCLNRDTVHIFGKSLLEDIHGVAPICTYKKWREELCEEREVKIPHTFSPTHRWACLSDGLFQEVKKISQMHPPESDFEKVWAKWAFRHYLMIQQTLC